MKKNIGILSNSGVLAATLYYDGQANQDLYIIMHGFMSSQRSRFLHRVRDVLLSCGHAVLMFDFNGHGKSDGRFQDMTVLSELDDARAVFSVASTWSWVQHIHLVGHSQGGVMVGLLASELGFPAVASVIQLAPAAVLHDDAMQGQIMYAKYDPQHIPDYVRLFLVKKVGKRYFEVAQNLDIYGLSCAYSGPVCLIHGTADTIVPVSYSEMYHALYANSELYVIDDENHRFSRKTADALRYIRQFIAQ